MLISGFCTPWMTGNVIKYVRTQLLYDLLLLLHPVTFSQHWPWPLSISDLMTLVAVVLSCILRNVRKEKAKADFYRFLVPHPETGHWLTCDTSNKDAVGQAVWLTPFRPAKSQVVLGPLQSPMWMSWGLCLSTPGLFQYPLLSAPVYVNKHSEVRWGLGELLVLYHTTLHVCITLLVLLHTSADLNLTALT